MLCVVDLLVTVVFLSCLVTVRPPALTSSLQIICRPQHSGSSISYSTMANRKARFDPKVFTISDLKDEAAKKVPIEYTRKSLALTDSPADPVRILQ